MKTKKTIHAIVKYFYPVAAGIETNMLETYKVFVENGWEVVVHTTTNTLTETNVLAPEETVQGITVKRYQWNTLGFAPNIPWESADVVALHNFNVVPHLQILGFVALRRWLGKKTPLILLTPHGGFTPDWEIFSPVVAWLKRTYHYTIGSRLINQSVDIFRTVSEWEKEEVIAHGVDKQKVITITNGIEDEALIDSEKKASSEIKQKVKSFGTYMIQIGRIYNIKNYETILRAMPKLPKNLNFVIVGPVGDDTYKTFLQDLSIELGIEKRVIFAGVIRGIDKYYLIKHSEFMIHMARWESFCNAVHEGMSQGKVVIVSDNYALPYLVKNNINGYCLPYNDVQGITEKISYVLDKKNKKVINEIEKRNREFAKNHSWRSVSHQVRKVLEQSV